jgi:protein phosphatase 4 regulatory subunit 3
MASSDSKRRVKLYVLNDMRQWDDRGTGYVTCIYSDKQRQNIALLVKSEVDGSILLESKILPTIIYQKQQVNNYCNSINIYSYI